MNIRKRLLISSVYFVQGVVSITGLAEFILTRNAFHFSWVQLAFLGALSTLTWSVKPLYGFLTDGVTIFGLRRKPYLIFSSLMALCGYWGMAFWGTGFLSIAIGSLIISIGLGFADVIIDGLVVENSTPETVGKWQALCWRSKGWGILLASLLSGLLLERAVFSKWLGASPITQAMTHLFSQTFTLEHVGNIAMLDIRYLLFFTGLWPLLTLALTLLVDEKKHIQTQPLNLPPRIISSAALAFLATLILVFYNTIHPQSFGGLKGQAITSLGLVLIWGIWILGYLRALVRTKVASITLLFGALFLFLWRFTPSFGAPWSDYFINTLHLSQEKLGLIGALSSISWIIGTWLYNRYFDRFPLHKLLKWTVLVGVIVSFTQLTLTNAELGMSLGNLPLIKFTAAVLLYPIYLIAYQAGAWGELMAQPGILNLDALLSFFLEIMFMISFLPILKLAAEVTPKGVEATNFSILASVMNLGLAFGTVSGGWIYTGIEGVHHLGRFHVNGLQLTVIIGALTSLLCLPVIPKLKNLK
jgi:MFS family permease